MAPVDGFERLVFQRGKSLEDLRGFWAIGDGVVFADFAVAEDEDAFGKLRDVVFVGNQDDGQSLVVQV